jgi:hypothetical protein
MLCVGFGLKWHDQDLIEVIFSKNSNQEQVDYNMRMLEIETAMAYSIVFDERWYEISMKTRATMVAGRLGRQWLESLQSEEMVAATKGAINVS